MIRHGERLRWFPHPGFTWRDLLVVLTHAPDDSPFARALTECGHSTAEHLALLTHHTLAGANWQRAGDKKQKPPAPPDCMLPPELREKQLFGGASMPIDAMHDWLGWGREPATA